jgi:hypothetical protein
MKTVIIFVAIVFALSLNGVNAQKRLAIDNFDQLPKGLKLDNSIVRSYQMTTDYMDYDLKANFLRKKRITGRYTCGLPGDSVRWNDVCVSQANDLKAQFPVGVKQEFMENFKYRTSDKILEKGFFKGTPEANMLMKNLVWDRTGFDAFAYCCWDSLKLNKEYRAKALNGEIDLAGEGTFENKEMILTWIGNTKMNNKLCAIIKYQTMNNPLKIELADMTMSGRSHYWGEVYVSLVDKQIEYATLSEDVITDVLIKGQSQNYLGYTVRSITLSRIK